jgi:glycosyltransferase involved in cell wall biosynthesis
MKICIVAMTGLYPVDLGGPGYVAYFIARELNQNGIDVTMFIRANDETFSRLKNSKEFRELNKTKIIPIDVEYNFKSILNPFYTIRKIIEMNKKLNEIIDEIDIVLYNSPPVDATIFFPFLFKTKSKKQIFALHGGLFYEGKNILGKFLLYLQKKQFDKVIAVSNYSRDVALNFGFDCDTIKVIPNGIDLKIFEEIEPLDLEGHPKLLYVGALRPIKGVDILLNAFSLFIKNFPNAHLYIVGDGVERVKLEQLSESLGIINNIHFEGFIPPGRDVLRYYKSCDLFIMPSYKENFPIVILEAMASKVPMIVSNIKGGPQELIIHEENGLLFPPGDYKTLCKEMIKITKSKELSEQIILKNSTLIKEYCWDKMALRYISTFKELQ